LLAGAGESEAVFGLTGVSLKLLLLGDSNCLDILALKTWELSLLVGVLGQAEGAISVSKATLLVSSQERTAAVEISRKLLQRGELELKPDCFVNSLCLLPLEDLMLLNCS